MFDCAMPPVPVVGFRAAVCGELDVFDVVPAASAAMELVATSSAPSAAPVSLFIDTSS
jgi:hypothetical protein